MDGRVSLSSSRSSPSALYNVGRLDGRVSSYSDPQAIATFGLMCSQPKSTLRRIADEALRRQLCPLRDSPIRAVPLYSLLVSFHASQMILIGVTYAGEVTKLLDLEPTPLDDGVFSIPYNTSSNAPQLSSLRNYFPRKMGSDLSFDFFGTTGFAGYFVVAWISKIEFLAAHSSQHCKRISPRGTLAQWFLLL